MSTYPCPACGNTTTAVVETRLHRSYAANTIRRRRRCPECWIKFDTIEQLFKPGGSRKLTPEQVAEIRQKLSFSTRSALARQYDVHVRTIQDIASGRTWPMPERNILQRKSTEESADVREG